MASARMPAIFFGHGNPMNALHTNDFTRGWAAVGRSLPRPRAALVVSAHWYLPATLVTAMERPRTIHDFGGFPAALSEVEYPAPGDPALARRVRTLLSGLLGHDRVGLDTTWGLDHGTWSVLRHVYPEAEVPIVQLSIDETEPAAFHYALGTSLAPLRDEGVLLIGSGNLVHNLHAYAWGRRAVEPFDWAVRFEQRVRDLLARGEMGPLIDYETMGPDAALSVPTPDHYLPLLYVLGARLPGDEITFPVEGVDGGSISMLAVRVG